MEVRLRLEGSAGATVALTDWLRSDQQLRGRVRSGAAPAEPGSMGAPTELLVTLASSGTAAVLARSLQVWLTQRHRDIAITIMAADGRSLTIDAKRVQPGEIEHLVKSALDVREDIRQVAVPATASDSPQPDPPACPSEP